MAVNPKSLLNLKPGERKPRYSEAKKKRNLSVTDTGWEKAKESIKEELGISVSELLEQIGRGKYKIVEVED